jgi:hypothetical protein
MDCLMGITGCHIVHNQTNLQLIWVDWETVGPGAVAQIGRVGPNSTTSMNGIAFPWCSNSVEVVKKAFRIYRDLWPDEAIPPWSFGDPAHLDWITTHLKPATLPLLYIFQKYQDNQAYFAVPDGVNDINWANIQWCGEGPSSDMDLYIESDPARAWTKAVVL